MDSGSTLDLIIAIALPNQPQRMQTNRLPLNLALVIDSLRIHVWQKLSYARKAARSLVAELTPQGWLAIVTFDDEANVLAPSQYVHHPLQFIRAINTINPGHVQHWALHNKV
jgi:Ca-activated chloride channel family protein